jgi:PAS domain S-box-containing protein
MSLDTHSHFTQCGLRGIERIPYGLHACHFYRDRDDLIAALVPFFIAGLRANERCLWVTAPPLPAREAIQALRAAWGGADDAVQTGALRVLDFDHWYESSVGLRGDAVVELWLKEEERALAEGYDGLRITGNTSFLEDGDWPAFMEYEAVVSDRFSGRRIVALCSYALDQCDDLRKAEILRIHHCAFDRPDGDWQVAIGDHTPPRKKRRIQKQSAPTPDYAATAGSFAALASLDQAALDAMPQAVYLCAADGTVERFNRLAAELWGRTPEAGCPQERFCGSFRLRRLDGSVLPHDQCPMAVALKSGESFHGQEVVVEQPNGQRRTVLVNIAALKDANGRVNGAINCFQDVSQRKQAEESRRRLTMDLLSVSQAIADNERRFREMIDALPAAIYTTDAAGRVTHFNPAAVALSGRTPELGTDRWCLSWKLYRPDGSPLPHDECPMALALKEGRTIRGEEIIAERPDGSRAWVAPYPTPLKDANGAVVGGINMLVDITEQREAERQLRLMVGELGHRVKNTLAVVQAIARQTLSDLSEEDRSAFEGRLMSLGRAHSLLTQQEWDFADLSGIVRELAEHDPRIAIEGPSVRLTPTLAINLSMALHELCTNATKYGALSSEHGRVSIAWGVAQAPRRLVLIWTETGGPPVAKAKRCGFGTRMIELAIGGEVGGSAHLDLRKDGVVCSIEAPLRETEG